MYFNPRLAYCRWKEESSFSCEGDFPSCEGAGLAGDVVRSSMASSMLFSEYERSRSEVESNGGILIGESVWSCKGK